MNLEIPYELKDVGLDWFVTGSRVLCNPPVVNTDLDIVMLVDAGFRDTELTELGYEPNLDCEYDAGMYSVSPEPNYLFRTYRKGEVNLIVVVGTILFERYRLATEWAKQINFPNKKDRAMFFMLVKYGSVSPVVDNYLYQATVHSCPRILSEV